jgi:hypothetical protein
MGANATTFVPAYVAGEVLTAADLSVTNSGIPVFATTVTRDAAFGGTGEKTLAEGQFAYLEDTNTTQYYDGAAWQSVAPTRQIAIFNETQASGTQGGTSTSGSFIKRVLNTTVVNNITGCSIASSVITLPAGTYLINAAAPFYGSAAAKIKLRNTTDSTDTIIGMSINSTQGITGDLTGYFTIAGIKNFEVQYRVQTGVAGYGLGAECTFGVSEVYSTIEIEKVG